MAGTLFVANWGGATAITQISDEILMFRSVLDYGKKLAQLQTKLEADQGFGEKLFSLETPEEVQGFLKEQGIEFSLDEIGALRNGLLKQLAQGNGELSEADLEDIAGGFWAGGSGGGCTIPPWLRKEQTGRW